ncbi:hypothetical protein PYCCODRAFT_1436790 [Trametes coccinea BRFM310]|uniref:Uncharacterized protein n=1 Tax=Trametes coccinea (strain BRFM310) TaxID=1353009 RepID=A0A1Y2IIS1_TRAC3|nr:hypothetical protein PYCCODRAFT_1436790 [Trametes coccinea BRFM310]
MLTTPLPRESRRAGLLLFGVQTGQQGEFSTMASLAVICELRHKQPSRANTHTSRLRVPHCMAEHNGWCSFSALYKGVQPPCLDL